MRTISIPATALLTCLLAACGGGSGGGDATPAPEQAKDAAPAEKPAATPAEKPAETPAAKPAEKPKAPAKPRPTSARIREADQTIALFKEKDSGMEKFFDAAHAYAVFPEVAKGGLIVSGAHGKGVVYEQGTPIGYTELSQGGIGATIGGQVYSEIVFMKTASALDDYKKGNVKLSAQASAVGATEGASANAGYRNGVAIFTIAKGGLMLEASVGGQGFSFEPLP